MENLISIIIPCYNAAKCIDKMLESLLNQTYKKLEIVFINDGSTDNTEKIIKEYIPKFQKEGMSVIYKYQTNQGLGGAINTGLKLFTGDFLCWADPDDYYEITAMEDRLNFLLANPEYGIVSSDAYIRDYDNLGTHKDLISNHYSKSELESEEQFELLINERSFFCSGTHMVRTSVFLKANPERDIYNARRGQNWQMLLPIYFVSKRHYLDKPLYNYIDWPNSMSKNKTDKSFLISRHEEHKEILIKTIENIEKTNNVVLSKYKDFVKAKFYKTIMHIAISYKDKELFKSQFNKKKKEVGLDIKDIALYIIAKIKI